MPLFLIPVWTFLKKVSFEVWVVIAIVGTAIFGIYTVDRNAVKRTTAKRDKQDLEATIVLQDKSTEIVNEIETRVEHADDAVARLPQFSSADELRRKDPDLADIILADPDRHER